MTHFQQRRDEAAIWASLNPVLMDGEAGHETDSGRWKLGDGVTAWNALAYKSGVDSVAGKTGDVELDIDDVDGAAPLDSPALTGTPTAPTRAMSSDSNAIATTEWVRTLLDTMWPIGTLYLSMNNTNPGTFIGGTWVAEATGRMLVGLNDEDADFNVIGETGGAKEVTLTAAQSGLRAHGHAVTDPGHAHTDSGVDVSPYISQAGGSYGVSVPAAKTTGNSVTGVTVNDAAAVNATEAHNNLPPYMVCRVWRRTA